RADARNGYRPRARLFVELLRCRSPCAPEPRDPPAPCAADGKRPAQNRAVKRTFDLDARNASVLLRRRNRHGRQCLPRRPRRRSHADAVVVRPQWRIFPRRPGPTLPAADYGLGLWFRGRQCRGTEPLALIAAELDQAADRRPSLAARVRPRHPTVPLPLEPQGHRLSARFWR